MEGNVAKFGLIIIIIHACNCGNFTDELYALTNEITLKYFSIFRCVTYVGDEPIPRWPSNQQILIIKRDADNFDELIQNGYDQDCSGFVVRVSPFDRSVVISDMIKMYKKSLYSRYNNKRYLFLGYNEGDNDVTFLDSHEMYYMPNLVFAMKVGDAFQIIEHNYFHGHKYDVLNIKHDVIDIWHSGKGFLKDEYLYPDKIKNLNGKTVGFSLIHYTPYAVVVKDGDEVSYDGVETEIAAQFVRWCNGTWTARDNPVHLWGDVFENGTGNGIFGTILDNTCDMGFAAIYQWYCHIVECSYPYIIARVTCLAPKPEKISGWLTVVQPFEIQTWIAFIFTNLSVTFSASFIVYLWHRIRRMTSVRYLNILGDSFFSINRLQLLQVPSAAFDRTPISYFFKIWILYCFIVALIWQSGIASFLTVPKYEEPINTGEELVSRFPKIKWGANHRAWVKSFDSTSDPVMVKLAKEFVVQDDETLRARSRKKDFAYFVERLPKGHIGMNSYIGREEMKYLRIMEDNLYLGFCVIVLTRGSPYQERLNQILLRLIDTGIILNIEEQVSLRRVDNELQNMIRTSTEKPSNTVTKLQVSHIVGAVGLFIAGMATSGLVFLIELNYTKKETKLAKKMFAK